MKVRFFSYIIISILLMTGCGGGSSGTGSRSFEGVVLTTSGTPLSNATVTIAETGDASITDQDGEFVVESDFSGSQATFIVEKGEFQSSVLVSDLGDESSQINFEIIVDEDANTTVVRGTDIRVKIVGECDIYFENRRVIRQSNEIPQNKKCTLEVTTRATRGALPNRSFRVEFQGCKSSSEWHTVGVGVTNDVGVSNFPFSFFDDSQHCLYRVLVPINDNGVKPQSFEIRTLTFQNYK